MNSSNAHNTINNFIDNIPRLEWACRRGMLELDVLLSYFLKEAYHTLSFSEKEQFVMLLNCTDPELFSWLLGQEVPEDTGLAHIIERIRRHARSRVSP